MNIDFCRLLDSICCNADASMVLELFLAFKNMSISETRSYILGHCVWNTSFSENTILV